MTKIASEIEPRLKDAVRGSFLADHEIRLVVLGRCRSLDGNHLHSEDLKML